MSETFPLICHSESLELYRATEGSAGYDLSSTVYKTILPGETALIPTGVRIAPESPDIVALLFGRSSLVKKNLIVANGVGVIDNDYRGEIKIALKNLGTESVEIEVGDRLAQLVFLEAKHPEIIMVDSVEKFNTYSTDRGEGGFGSTGK
jgi:dUTP pyrophosphatase